MVEDTFIESALAMAEKQVQSLPLWRRAALERARAAEVELGYIRGKDESPRVLEASGDEQASASTPVDSSR